MGAGPLESVALLLSRVIRYPMAPATHPPHGEELGRRETGLGEACWEVWRRRRWGACRRAPEPGGGKERDRAKGAKLVLCGVGRLRRGRQGGAQPDSKETGAWAGDLGLGWVVGSRAPARRLTGPGHAGRTGLRRYPKSVLAASRVRQTSSRQLGGRCPVGYKAGVCAPRASFFKVTHTSTWTSGPLSLKRGLTTPSAGEMGCAQSGRYGYCPSGSAGSLTLVGVALRSQGCGA